MVPASMGSFEKSAVFWKNGARLYGLDDAQSVGALDRNTVESTRTEYRLAGTQRSNRAYGYIRNRARFPSGL
jgi:hypothetical protein